MFSRTRQKQNLAENLDIFENQFWRSQLADLDENLFIVKLKVIPKNL